MSYRQLISPNLDPVIYENGKQLTDFFGWCLAYVRTAFGTGSAGLYALQAWESHTVNRHADSNIPDGVYVPVFFSGYGGQGHIAIYYNGQIYSAPWHHKATYDLLPSLAELERIYNVKYLGWAEGLAGKQFVEAIATPVAPPFTIDVTPFSGQYTVNGNKWNLDLPNFNAIEGSPLASPPSTPVTFTAQLKRSDLPQYTYYLEDGNVHQGYNSLDCVVYTPPPPTPYVPPKGAAPIAKAETYTLVTNLPYYSTNTAVQSSQSSSGVLPAGTYYVWEKAGANDTYYNLTSDNTKNLNHWVNTLYNKVPVVQPVARQSVTVEPITAPSMTTAEIRASYRPISDGPMAVLAKTNILVTDIVGSGSPKTVKADDKPFHIYGTFRKNSQYYAMPKIDASDPEASNYMYGIPIASSTSLEPFLEAAYGYPEVLRYGISALFSKIKTQVIDGILWPPKK